MSEELGDQNSPLRALASTMNRHEWRKFQASLRKRMKTCLPCCGAKRHHGRHMPDCPQRPGTGE